MTMTLLFIFKGKFGAAPLVAAHAAASLIVGAAIGETIGAALRALGW
jgi:hypothetical protein